MRELSQYWRDVGRDIRIPFAPVNEVDGVIVGVQECKPGDFFSGNAQPLELDLEFVAIDAHEAHFGEGQLCDWACQRGGDASAWFAAADR